MASSLIPSLVLLTLLNFPLTNSTSPKYTLIWADEFDRDGAPNPANWTFEEGMVRNEEYQCYQRENAWVEAGRLILEARRERVPNPGYDPQGEKWNETTQYAEYTSASLMTKGLHTWQYGRFEMKARIPTDLGLWPAFWTLGKGEEWPQGGEIDIMEYYASTLLANAAWASMFRWKPVWDAEKKPIAQFADMDWASKFHVWRMDWTRSAIKLYVDGELMNTVRLSKTRNQRGKVKNPFREVPQYILISLAIGGTQGGDPANTSFPQRMEVEYVRVFKQ